MEMLKSIDFFPQKSFKLDENIKLNGYTVLFPSVCVGNAAQLAVDLLISTLEMKKIASIWHVSIHSMTLIHIFISITAIDLFK